MIDAVAEFDEVLGFDSGTDARENIKAKHDRQLDFFGGSAVELPENRGGNNGETSVGKGVECLMEVSITYNLYMR